MNIPGGDGRPRCPEGEESKIPEDSSSSSEELQCFEDLLEAAGCEGRRNVLIFVLCIWCGFASPFPTLSYQFLGTIPEHWCLVEPLVRANWTQDQIKQFAIPLNAENSYEGCLMYDIPYESFASLDYEESLALKERILWNTTKECEHRQFDRTAPPTVVTEWDLVCSRLPLYSTTQAMVQIGKLVGSSVFGYLLDAYGRRPVILVAMLAYIVLGIVTATLPYLGLYLVFRVAVSALATGIYIGGFVLVLEFCTTKQRSYIGSLYGVSWAIGYVMVPGIAYIVRPWYWLQVALTLPALTYIPYFWVLPESPRWLILHGKMEDAHLIVSSIAASNGRKLPSSEKILALMTDIYEKENRRKESETSSLFHKAAKMASRITVLLRLREYRLNLLLIFFGWCSVSFVYYGVSLNATNIGTDKYQYILYGGLLEIPSYVLLWPCIAYIGRRKVLVGLFLLCGLTVFVLMGIILAETNGRSQGLLMFFSLIGKFAITAAFHLLYMMTAEIFPTKFRSLAIGEASVCARIGSILSPYVNDVLGEKTSWLPSCLFGSFSVLAAVTSSFLPETKDMVLQDRPHDSKDTKVERKDSYNNPAMELEE